MFRWLSRRSDVDVNGVLWALHAALWADGEPRAAAMLVALEHAEALIGARVDGDAILGVLTRQDFEPVGLGRAADVRHAVRAVLGSATPTPKRRRLLDRLG